MTSDPILCDDTQHNQDEFDDCDPQGQEDRPYIPPTPAVVRIVSIHCPPSNGGKDYVGTTHHCEQHADEMRDLLDNLGAAYLFERIDGHSMAHRLLVTTTKPMPTGSVIQLLLEALESHGAERRANGESDAEIEEAGDVGSILADDGDHVACGTCGAGGEIGEASKPFYDDPEEARRNGCDPARVPEVCAVCGTALDYVNDMPAGNPLAAGEPDED